ncbi:MAG: pentapeptide repeat-containing protein [Clostridia bacterium]|nr:pentapeptide repeat-containing protein [Clostridia bacterium]
MYDMVRRFRLYDLPHPESLFEVEKYEEWQQKECLQGSYYIEGKRAAEVYARYGEELSRHGFLMRVSLAHASVWEKNAAILIMESFEDSKDACLVLSFVRAPEMERIFLETDKGKLFELDFKRNARWVQMNRFKPYFIWLKYSGADFSGVKFRRTVVRFADFYRCNFQHSSWHACRFHLSVDGGELFCKFVNCDFTGSNFLGVDFSRCQFFNCNFSECRFRNCKFDYTVMDNCCFDDFDMVRCKTEHLFFLNSKEVDENEAE